MSAQNGRLTLDIQTIGPTLTLLWVETGGPPIDGPPERQGFGSRLAELSIVQQLGGTLERRWERAGLRAEIGLLAARLSRETNV